MSGSLDPATANASSADHVVQFFPRKPVLLGRRVLSFFARLGRLRFHRVARALLSAEVYPPSILFPYFALPCTILTCLCASVCFWQRYCRFGIGAAALLACSQRDELLVEAKATRTRDTTLLLMTLLLIMLPMTPLLLLLLLLLPQLLPQKAKVL